jgi:sterol desaturase/sphingolipid hydroxylase (fatty acid hydroxylase superfamily)
MPTNSDFIVQFVDVSTWTLSSYFIFAGLIFLGLEILSRILPYLFSTMKEIPIKGKHLDELSFLDNLFIFMNKLLTVIFVYHLLIVVNSSSTIKWGYETLTMTNTIGSLLSFYVFYDFFYMLIHRMLHIKFLYPLIHKHHHRQKAPSRGNLDAINVHPIEFLLGWLAFLQRND